MTYRLEFYRTIRGGEPALDYVRAQIKAHRAKIGRALTALEELVRAKRYRADWLERFGGEA